MILAFWYVFMDWLGQYNYAVRKIGNSSNWLALGTPNGLKNVQLV